MSLGEMFGARPKIAAEETEVIDCTEEVKDVDPTRCRRCRRSLVVEHMSKQQTSGKKTGCPFSSRLKQYKRVATESDIEWRLTDAEALALMRAPCSLCGIAADPEAGKANGITRLRAVPKQRGMGPYVPENVATACPTCNQLKGTHKVASVQCICRSIATHRGLGDFGAFPALFRNNISRKSRSCYIGDTARKRQKSKGTVGSKTHSLTNAEFNSIVEGPCHFCGKESDPPRHYNGLDRLDNSLRVYTVENAVSCCGTCNMAKGRLSESLFLEQCRAIAARALATGAAEVEALPEWDREEEFGICAVSDEEAPETLPGVENLTSPATDG